MRTEGGDSRKVLVILIGVLVFAGSFFVGIGMQRMVENVAVRREYRDSSLSWKTQLYEGTADEVARDMRNQALFENMKYVSVESLIYVEGETGEGKARIENQAENEFWCTVAIVRDATGEVLYESGLIEPGHYLEYIRVRGSLREGYYPCTAVLSFYTQEEEYAGETACKVVVIVKG